MERATLDRVHPYLCEEAVRILHVTGSVSEERDPRTGKMQPSIVSRKRYLDVLSGGGPGRSLSECRRRLEELANQVRRDQVQQPRPMLVWW